MKIITVIISLLFVNAAISQSGLKFHSQNYVGTIEGQAASAFQFQTINGFQKGNWFAGLGTGLDYYYYRTVPLFLSFTRYITPKERSFFVSADGGTNFFWGKTNKNPIINFGPVSRFTPSLYYGGSVGYKIGLENKKDAILFSIGYSAKHLKENIKTNNFCINPPCGIPQESYQYKLNRLSLKVGWMF